MIYFRHNPMKCTYVLPNGSNIKKGYIKTSETPTLEDEQVVTLTNERFSIPELLFNPSDIGKRSSDSSDFALILK